MSTQLLLNLVYNTPKKIITTDLFEGDHKICLLSFIGASDYFITDFGLIWNRSKVFPNKDGHLSKYYQPWVFRDTVYVHPWVLLPVTTGLFWFPVMQLLGWAFYFIDDKTKRYYLPQGPQLLPLKADDGEWLELPPMTSPRSRYLTWIEEFYKE